jgi:hypothetical protein
LGSLGAELPEDVGRMRDEVLVFSKTISKMSSSKMTLDELKSMKEKSAEFRIQTPEILKLAD